MMEGKRQVFESKRSMVNCAYRTTTTTMNTLLYHFASCCHRTIDDLLDGHFYFTILFSHSICHSSLIKCCFTYRFDHKSYEMRQNGHHNFFITTDKLTDNRV
ncbi:hypothetical protein BLOT_005817 [Blomia tropicalis]|nr:hypothetical protein BLOT_005817 [Blomia tropicalis]